MNATFLSLRFAAYYTLSIAYDNGLLQDIITEAPTFDIKSFVPVLRERMYTKERSASLFSLNESF